MCKWSALPKTLPRSFAAPDQRKRSRSASPNFRALLAQLAVSEAMGVPLPLLCSGTRGGKKAAFARQIAMYLCRLSFLMGPTAIAEAFGRDRTTASYAIARIEEAREDAEFDRHLQRLEAALQRLVAEGGVHG